MKKKLCVFAVLAVGGCLWTAGLGAAGTGASGEDPSTHPQAVVAPRPKSALQARRFAAKADLVKYLQQAPAFPEKFAAAQGLAASDADPATGNAWVTVIDDGRAPADHAYGGFYTVTVENTSGVPWTASIKASFAIEMLQGQATLGIYVFRDNTNFLSQGRVASSAGTYALGTSSFTIEPGKKYHAILRVFCEPPAGQSASAKARIGNVKWDIEL